MHLQDTTVQLTLRDSPRGYYSTYILRHTDSSRGCTVPVLYILRHTYAFVEDRTVGTVHTVLRRYTDACTEYISTVHNYTYRCIC